VYMDESLLEKCPRAAIKPALGHLPVQAITWADVNAFDGAR
jgi:hypothetical protein